MMSAMQRFEIVIDREYLLRQAEKVTSTEFFQELMSQVAKTRRV